MECRVRLDVAAMLVERVLNNVVRGEVWRYISVDASPQFGVECFCGIESFVERGQAESSSAGSGRQNRLLPMVTLGVGKYALLDKIMAFLWVVFLIAGPRSAGLKQYCASIYSITTDFGGEGMMCDFGDVTSQFFQGHTQLPAEMGPLPVEALFPNALRIPGMNHVVDKTWEEGLAACEFSPLG